MKTCTKCKEAKAFTEFNKHAGRSDGLDSKCRECNRFLCAKWLKDNPDKAKEIEASRRLKNRLLNSVIKVDPNTINKECTKCKVVKSLSEYPKAPSCKGGYKSACKVCYNKVRKEKKERYKVAQKQITTTSKVCVGCNKNKLLSQFYKDIEIQDGRKSRCIDCEKNKSAKYREENRELLNSKVRDYHWKNRAKRLDYKKKWDNENTDKVKAYRAYYLPKANAISKHKRETDPGFRITARLRARIYSVLKFGYKSAKTIELLGCGIEELKTRFERQFTKGMNWENIGEWHIDHIIPCASFDLTDPEQQKQCFHYTNLQPLWAKANISKGARLKEPVQISIPL
jgi:hypothetical protein